MKCIDKVSLFFCFTYTIRNDPGNMNTVIFILPGSFLIVYVKQKNKETLSIHFIVNPNICFAMSEYFFQRTKEDTNLDNGLGQAQK
jgi:hypothetical protein